LFTLVLIIAACASFASPGNSHVVVVIAGSCSVRDFANPNLHELSALFENGSAALLNVRAGRASRDAEPGSRSGFEAGCLSLGASAMAAGGAEVRRAGDANGLIEGIKVKDLFTGRTDINPRAAEVLHTEIAKIQHINAAASYHAKPGSLGSALHLARIRTAIIGNSDLPNEIHREATAAAMDEMGIVDYGEVDTEKVTQADPTAPYGIRTNPDGLLKELDRVFPQSRFIVVDFGDTIRADAYADSCTDEQAAIIKNRADARLSRFISRLKERLDPRSDLLVLLSPNARSYSEIDGERMGAIVISGPGFSRGMLISPSTRKPGIVTIADVAPTILAFLGAKPTADMVGRPVKNIAGGSAVEALLKLNLDESGQAQRQPIMRGSSVVQSSVVALVTVVVLLFSLAWVRRLAAWLSLTVVAIPLAMLYMPLIYSGGLVGSSIVLIVLTLVLLGACSLTFRSPARAFVWLCATMVISLAVDLVRGGSLIGSSIGSYNAVEGARYYGIGNELMGTLLGAAIAWVGLMISAGKVKGRVASAFAVGTFAAVLVLMVAPNLGAKVGGALAAAPAIAVALLARRGWKPSVRGVVLIGVFTVLVVMAMFAFDALHGGSNQSHAGRVVSTVANEGAAGLFAIFGRKIALNFMLVATSMWSRLLGLSLGGSIILFWWGKRQFGEKFLTKEEAAAALGCCVGTAAAFAFNDSGVVAGATCSVFLWAMLALKILDPGVKKPEE